jgi:hypothetical protein
MLFSSKKQPKNQSRNALKMHRTPLLDLVHVIEDRAKFGGDGFSRLLLGDELTGFATPLDLHVIKQLNVVFGPLRIC